MVVLFRHCTGIRVAVKVCPPGVTHSIPVGKVKYDPQLCTAALRQAVIVSWAWLEAVIAAGAMPDPPRNAPARHANEEDEDYRKRTTEFRETHSSGADLELWGFSSLEKAFSTNWPKESEAWPGYKEAAAAQRIPDVKRWRPNEARTKLFRNIAVFAFQDPDQSRVRYFLALRLVRAESIAARCIRIHDEDRWRLL